MHSAAWQNGEWLASAVAPAMSLQERDAWLGESVFETLRADGTTPRGWDRHLRRLERGVVELELPLPWSAGELRAVAEQLLGRVGAGGGRSVLRLTVARGHVSLWATSFSPWPEEVYRDGIETTVVAPRRIPRACFSGELKLGGAYLPSVLARRALAGRGLREGLMLSCDGQLSCGTFSNVFVVLAGELCTPHAAADCRLGTTRERLLELAPTLGLRAQERALQLDELEHCDEWFFANALRGCVPVRALSLPNQTLRWSAPGPWTTKLASALEASP